MPDTKTWWQSRTIWLQIVATLFAVLGTFGILPRDLDQEQVVSAIMGAVAIVTLILRLRSTHAIARPTVPPEAKDAAAKITTLCLAVAIPALMLTSLSACATVGSGPSMVQRVAAVQTDFDQARACAAPFLGFLSPERAATVRAVAEMVQQALAIARSATAPAVRADALRTAEKGIADYRLVAGG